MKKTDETTAKKQVKMHIDFFEKTKAAIEGGFYLEAIFREYAAIEARLEVLLGIFGAPCNKNAKDEDRRKVNVSQRVECMKRMLKAGKPIPSFGLDVAFFNKLENWIKARNTIVHGFYKNELQYAERSRKNEELAQKGLEYVKKLYNEIKRVRRYAVGHPDNDLFGIAVCLDRAGKEKCISK